MDTTTEADAPAANDTEATHAGPSNGRFVSIRAIERGTDIHIRNAFVGGAIGERVSLSRAVVRHAYGGSSLELRQGGAGVIATAGGASIQQGGAQAILSAGPVTMHQAGAVVAMGRSIEIERGGTVLFGIGRLQVHEGGRLVAGPRVAAVVAVGLAVIGAALVATWRRRTTSTMNGKERLR